MESIHLNRQDHKADQLVTELIGRIQTGTLAVGERLPSIRQLALELGLNRNTVAAVFKELAERGFIESRFGGGSFARMPNQWNEPLAETRLPAPVSPLRTLTETDWERRLARRWNGWLNPGAQTPLFRSGHPQPINLFQQRPATGVFPLTRFRQCLNSVLRRGGGSLLNYGSPGGYLPLREQIALRLKRRGVRADANQILITSGSQQGIDLISRAFLEEGDSVVVESPMYSIALKIFGAYGARLIPYPVSRSGVSLDQLETALNSSLPPKLFYAVPNYQNPTTHCYTLPEKQALLSCVVENDSLLVEDDSDNELRDPAVASPAMAAFDGLERGLYLNTFSKTLVPALRAGYLAGPAPMIRRLTEIKEMTDLSHSLILQAAIAEFMERGYFEDHVARVGTYYRSRMQNVLEMLEKALPPETPFSRPEGGLCVWVDLPSHLDTDLLFRHLQQKGVLISPGSLYQPGQGGRNGLRLCVTAEDEERLTTGIKLLGAELKQVLGQPPPTPLEQEYQAMH